MAAIPLLLIGKSWAQIAQINQLFQLCLIEFVQTVTLSTG